MSLLSAPLTVALLVAPTPSSASCRGPLGRAAVVACALAQHPSKALELARVVGLLRESV
ncbi:hypothetical protein [Nannocystis bainbridge]|uniref:Secreted protein n=1 Tax=Nannocystis bainbridge TaxID=2995303 RepID=A0ABT5E4P0_9BACT|nr:hypothetical protein [Nannocystis bainbridge]MDC0720839.1 hypothetical protein [Nannocystis bainbridge]